MEYMLPIRGVSKGMPVDKEPQLTSGDMNNARPRCSLEGKVRISQRPALDKWGAGTQIGGAEQPVVAMCIVSSVV